MGRTQVRRSLDLEDMGQHLVLDLDQTESSLGDFRARGRHRRHGVPVVEGPVPGHDIVGQVVHVVVPTLGRRLLGEEIGQVGAGDDGVHASESLGGPGFDGEDSGVGMGAAQHPPPEHVGQGKIGSVTGAPGHLVGAIGPNRPGSHPAEFLLVAHPASPRKSAAASSTERTILSYPVQRQRLPASQ